jgi:hypothetical protein
VAGDKYQDHGPAENPKRQTPNLKQTAKNENFQISEFFGVCDLRPVVPTGRENSLGKRAGLWDGLTVTRKIYGPL